MRSCGNHCRLSECQCGVAPEKEFSRRGSAEETERLQSASLLLELGSVVRHHPPPLPPPKQPTTTKRPMNFVRILPATEKSKKKSTKEGSSSSSNGVGCFDASVEWKKKKKKSTKKRKLSSLPPDENEIGAKEVTKKLESKRKKKKGKPATLPLEEDESKMKSGSLDITCRRVMLALNNKMRECFYENGRGQHLISFKFQAAQLSDDINEVRRRVYDVLPVLEAIGVVSRHRRLYIHHGIHRIGQTVEWVHHTVHLAQNLVNGVHGDGENVKASDPQHVRDSAAGSFLKQVIENGPQYTAVGELIDISNMSLSQISAMLYLSSQVNGELKTLGIITLHLLVLMLLEGEHQSASMSELGERIQIDPADIFLLKNNITDSLLSLKNSNASRSPLNSISSDLDNNTFIKVDKNENHIRSAKYGRRLYDVVSVLSGVGLVSTSLISRLQTHSLKQTGYKSKCVQLNPSVFSDDVCNLHEHLNYNYDFYGHLMP